jgi:hypothetical protein
MVSPERLNEPQRDHQSSNAIGVAARLYWMLGGNAVLGFLAIFIAKAPSLFSWFDLAYWMVWASLVAVRYADVMFLRGTTGDGTPATLSHWRRYSVVLSLVCAAVWAAGHATGLFMGR